MATSSDSTIEVKVEGTTPNLDVPVTWELLLRIHDTIFTDPIALQKWDSIARDLLSPGMETERIRVQRLMTIDPQEGIWLSLQAWFSTGGNFRELVDLLRMNRLHSIAEKLAQEFQPGNENGTASATGTGQTSDEQGSPSKIQLRGFHLHQIRDTLLNDRLAMDKWRYIKDYLVRNHQEAHRVDALLKAGDVNEALLLTLTMWVAEIGTSATWGNLINLLRTQGLMRVSDKLRELGLKAEEESF